MSSPDLLLTPNRLLLTPDKMAITKASTKKRAAMRKRSPYVKSVIKAGKTNSERHVTAKKDAVSVTKSLGKKTLTKAERLEAKARAKEWAKRELGWKRRMESESRPSSFQANAADSTRLASVETKDSGAIADLADIDEMSSINKDMINALNEAGKCDNQFVFGDISEDVFYDALDFFEEDETTKKDVTVEEASDDEDDDMINLRSSIRNQVPTHSWMEPVGSLYSDVLELRKQKPDP